MTIETKKLVISEELKIKDQPLKLISSINCNLAITYYSFLSNNHNL